MILISKKINCEVNIIKQRSRLLVIHLKGEGIDVVIANVYAPNLKAEKKIFFDLIFENLNDFEGSQVIIMGAGMKPSLYTSFTHCTDRIFSKELVILGSKANVVTDRILDLCILIAKYNIFIAKLYGTIPHLNVFTRFLKNRAVLEKYYYTLNGRSNKFHAEWMLYSFHE